MAIPRNLDKQIEKNITMFKPEILKYCFPNGMEQMRNVVISLFCFLGNDKEIDDLLKLFIETKMKLQMKTEDEKTIIKHAMLNHQRILFSVKNMEVVIGYIKVEIKMPGFKVETIDQAEFIFKNMQDEKNALEKQRLEKEKQYGIKLEDPIYVKGTLGLKEFITNLNSLEGNITRWVRTDSVLVKGIPGKVEVYDSYLSTGEKYGTIYINLEGNRAPERLPFGYKNRK